jgi:predicted nucleic acid-binding protein
VTGFLLDTNVIVEPRRPRPDPAVLQWLGAADEAALYLSAFTFAELRKGIAKLSESTRVDRLERDMAALRDRFAGRILAIDDDVLDAWGRITGSAAAAGRPLPGIDALFVATALEHGLTLVTRNERHMAASGVAVLNPWV